MRRRGNSGGGVWWLAGFYTRRGRKFGFRSGWFGFLSRGPARHVSFPVISRSDSETFSRAFGFTLFMIRR